MTILLLLIVPFPMTRVHNLGGFLEKMEDWSTIFGKVQYLLQHSLFLGIARKEGNIENLKVQLL